MITKIYIGDSKLDLYGDESINLNSSVADISDITKNKTDFTKSFNVPASDNNNTIFKHYYEADLDGGFDARIKADGRIELDGMPFKIGKFRLNGVKMKEGKAESYNINFFGNLISIKDSVKNDELRDLDLSAYNHNYNPANVKEALTTTAFTNGGAFTAGDIIYNLFVQKQYFYDSSGATASNSTNISWTGTQGVTWNDLRPSIRLVPIIEAIEAKYNLTFSRDFFGSTSFAGLYMWLNKSDEEGNLNSIDQVNITSKGTLERASDVVNLDSNYYGRNSSFPSADAYGINITVTPSSGYEDVEYRIKRYVNETYVDTTPYNTGTRALASYIGNDPFGYRYSFYVEVRGDFAFTTKIDSTAVDESILGTTTTAEQSITLSAQASSLFPKLKVIDFLKGIFNMYKLVVIPQDDGTIYVNTLKAYYEEGSVINATKYVDYNNYDISRGEILNTIFYNFSEPKTILNIEYDNQNNIYYGDAENYLYDSEDIDTRELLDGEELEFKIPFEQVVYERLPDLNNLPNLTNVMYGAIVDENVDPINIEPHIFYNINKSTASNPVAFINDLGGREQLNSLNVPSHVDNFETPSYSTVFGSHTNEWNGAGIINTLYLNYHSDYVESIFNIKRRDFKFKAKNFPLNLLRTIDLNDVIEIKNNYYRIDKLDINLTNGEVMFHLVNSVLTGVNAFSPDRSSITVGFEAQSESIYVANLGNFSTAKVDTGDGITWVTITNVGKNIFFAFDENTTDEIRSMQVTVTDTDTLQDFTVTLTQFDSGITSFRYYLSKNTINFINFQ